MKNLINIGIPSKGRLRKDVLKIFTKKRLKLISERGERDLIGSIKNKLNIKDSKKIHITKDEAAEFYKVHQSKPFYLSLIHI